MSGRTPPHPPAPGSARTAGPIRIVPLPGAPPPVEALARLRGRAHRVLLETAGGAGSSFLAADPVAILRARRGRAELAVSGHPTAERGEPAEPGESAEPDEAALRVRQAGDDAEEPAAPGPATWTSGIRGADPFTALERLLGCIGPGRTPRRARRGDEGEALAPAGGLFGYLAYEAGDALERLPPPPPGPVSECWFGVYAWIVAWGSDGRCTLRGRCLPGMDPVRLDRELEGVRSALLDGGAPPEPRGAVRRDGGGGPERLRKGPRRLRKGPESVPLPGHPGAFSSLGEARFRAGVERIREYIRAGDVYQANLTHRISRATAADGETLLRRLRRESPAPYVAYLDADDEEVVSVSPECFLSVRGSRVETRPIKGTASRGATPEEDRALAEALEGSPKERAENVMIVDLLRNDLSRVCADGSVEVPFLLRLESHPTVHHLVSVVRGKLREEAGVVDLLRATFPGGSITGAPRIRAMEILRELEPVPRGAYTGALGLLTFEGDAELSVAIRTAVLRDGVAEYGTGGGITLASDAEAEWRETLQKAAAFLRATDR